jgi:hypothetical protein
VSFWESVGASAVGFLAEFNPDATAPRRARFNASFLDLTRRIQQGSVGSVKSLP